MGRVSDMRSFVDRGTLAAAAAMVMVASCGGGSATETPTPVPVTEISLLELQTVVSYDAAADEYPEALTIDNEGNIYVSVARLGQIRKIAPDGTESIFFDFGGPKSLGLAAGDEGQVYVGLYGPNTDRHGVHRIDSDGTSTRIPGSEDMVHPNGLELDDEGNLYISDSEAGTLWRAPHGGSAELWLQHEVLEGTDELPGYPPIGANGVAFWQDGLYVANTEKNHIVRVPILKHGKAGKPEILAPDTRLPGPDGITVDMQGRIYAALGASSKVVLIDPASGEISELASRSDGLSIPSDAVFSTRVGEGQVLYLSNYAVQRGGNPAILRLDLVATGQSEP
jgi:sugar lactone lactonase YvrE